MDDLPIFLFTGDVIQSITKSRGANVLPTGGSKIHLIENNGLVSVENDTALSDVLDRGGEHVAFDVAASVGQLLGAHSVVDPDDILLNDRTLVEIARDKVGSSANDLDTAIIGLVVGLGTLERGQEAVVDVDDTPRHGLAQFRRENLHVAGEDDQVDVVIAHEIQDLGLLLRLGIGGNGEVVEGDVVGSGQGREVGVVGDDQGDLNVKLAGRLTEQQVIEAVADLRDHDHHAGLLDGGVDLEVHREGFRCGVESSAQLLELHRIAGRGELHAHEEALGSGISELRRVDNVQIVLDEEGRDGVDNAGAIGPGQGKNEAGSHVE